MNFIQCQRNLNLYTCNQLLSTVKYMQMQRNYKLIVFQGMFFFRTHDTFMYKVKARSCGQRAELVIRKICPTRYRNRWKPIIHLFNLVILLIFIFVNIETTFLSYFIPNFSNTYDGQLLGKQRHWIMGPQNYK